MRDGVEGNSKHISSIVAIDLIPMNINCHVILSSTGKCFLIPLSLNASQILTHFLIQLLKIIMTGWVDIQPTGNYL